MKEVFPQRGLITAVNCDTDNGWSFSSDDRGASPPSLIQTNDPENWRPSSDVYGSPGKNENDF